MRWMGASLIVIAAVAASPAAAGSSSVTMGVGLTVVANCRTSNCAAQSHLERRPIAIRAATAPHSLNILSATAASPGIITITY